MMKQLALSLRNRHRISTAVVKSADTAKKKLIMNAYFVSNSNTLVSRGQKWRMYGYHQHILGWRRSGTSQRSLQYRIETLRGHLYLRRGWRVQRSVKFLMDTPIKFSRATRCKLTSKNAHGTHAEAKPVWLLRARPYVPTSVLSRCVVLDTADSSSTCCPPSLSVLISCWSRSFHRWAQRTE